MILAETTSAKRSPEADGEPSKTSLTRNLSVEFSKAWANASLAAEAPASIYALKSLRIAVIVVGVIAAIIAMTVVAAYGFYLLDDCLAYCLSAPALPIWFSGLIRGLVYTLAPASGLFYIWHITVGFSEKMHSKVDNK